jgi:hypothetical protein
MKKLLLVLLMSSSASAGEMCDMQHRCYPEQPYYDIHGNRIPAPAPQYPQPKPLPVPGQITVQPTIASNVCKLARIRVAPEAPQTIIEICTMSDEEEKMYRQRQRDLQASVPRMYLNGEY